MTPPDFIKRRIRRKPAKSEHCLQRAIVNWCEGLGKNVVQERFAAIPNGGARDIVTASRLKQEGARAGMPDLIFWGHSGRVLWLEVKNGTSGQISASQKIVHAKLKSDGHLVIVCRDLMEAIEAIQSFYGGKNE
jgi:hypothetical protein